MKLAERGFGCMERRGGTSGSFASDAASISRCTRTSHRGFEVVPARSSSVRQICCPRCSSLPSTERAAAARGYKNVLVCQWSECWGQLSATERVSA
eukprot:COSAG01_NODE_9979_length_2285_cov_1.987649_1_plen_95_part_10